MGTLAIAFFADSIILLAGIAFPMLPKHHGPLLNSLALTRVAPAATTASRHMRIRVVFVKEKYTSTVSLSGCATLDRDESWETRQRGSCHTAEAPLLRPPNVQLTTHPFAR